VITLATGRTWAWCCRKQSDYTWLHGSSNSEYVQSRIQTNVAISDDARGTVSRVVSSCGSSITVRRIVGQWHRWRWWRRHLHICFRSWKLSLIFICMLKPRLCDVLACRPYSVGRRTTARHSLASNPLYLLLQWRCIKCESTFACNFAFYTYLLSHFQVLYQPTIVVSPTTVYDLSWIEPLGLCCWTKPGQAGN